MGEISEMMLTGVMCAGCGEWLACQTKEVEDSCEDAALPTYCSEACARGNSNFMGKVCPHS